MLNMYDIGIPIPADFFKQIYAEIRKIKLLFQERFILDHDINGDHNKLTLREIKVNLLQDKSPFPMNWDKGAAEIPKDGGILFFNNGALTFARNTNKGIKQSILGVWNVGYQ